VPPTASVTPVLTEEINRICSAYGVPDAVEYQIINGEHVAEVARYYAASPVRLGDEERLEEAVRRLQDAARVDCTGCRPSYTLHAWAGDDELVITTIGVRGMPLLRFRTGDICQYYTDPCACGRHSLRVSPLLGRKGQMIKFKGTSLYPPALYDVLDNVDGIETYVVEAYTNAVGTDEVIVRIAVQAPSDDFVKQLKDLFRARVRVAPTIEFATREYIEQLRQPPKSRKVQKFIDRRN